MNYSNPFDLIGKIPPSAIEMEAAVIGMILLENKAHGRIADMLRPEMFYKGEHQVLYSAIESMLREGKAADILTVTQYLREEGKLDYVGGAYAISQMTTRIVGTYPIQQYALSLIENYLRRELITLGSQTSTDAYDTTLDVFDLVDKTNRQLTGILTQNVKPSASHVAQLQRGAIEDITNRNATANYIHGIPFYIPSVDKVIGGMGKGDLFIIAARPAMGKTAYVLSAALRQAQAGKPVLIFSLEMSKEQLNYRLLSTLTGINGDRLMKQPLNQDEIMRVNQAMGQLERLPIYIDDTAALNVWSARSIAQRYTEQFGVEVAYVDYLQLMTVDGKRGGSREQEVSEISRTLKQTAKDCRIPVVALSQLSRATESRGDKRPILSDLRESGSIEQDADEVAFLYRPEYYGIPETENGEPSQGRAEFIIAKNRHGGIATVNLGFSARTTTFYDPNEGRMEPREAPHPDARIEPNTSFLVNGEPPF